MMKSLPLVFAATVAFSSCVPLPKWQTPSGKPEVMVKGTGAKGKVIGRMVSKNWEVKSESDHAITFERQQLSAGNRAVFALGGDAMGILEGWNIVLVPESSGTRVTLTSAYVHTKNYGKSTNPPTQKVGDEFMATFSGL